MEKQADLLLRSEIVHDVEELPDLFGRLALDHISDSLAPHIAINDSGQYTRERRTTSYSRDLISR